MALTLLAPRGGSPPPAVFLLVPVVFLAVSWLTNRLMGIPAPCAATRRCLSRLAAAACT